MTNYNDRYHRVRDLVARGIFCNGKLPPKVEDWPEEDRGLLEIVKAGMDCDKDPTRRICLCDMARGPVYTKGKDLKIKCGCKAQDGRFLDSAVLSKDRRCIYSGQPYEPGYFCGCPLRPKSEVTPPTTTDGSYREPISSNAETAVPELVTSQ